MVEGDGSTYDRELNGLLVVRNRGEGAPVEESMLVTVNMW